MRSPDARSAASGARASGRYQLRRAGAAWRIVSSILRGMHRIDPVAFWATVVFGVGARFATLGQFVIVLRALFSAIEGSLTPANAALYAGGILVASLLRLTRLRLQRLYVGRLCRQAAAELRGKAGRKAYAGFKATVYGKSTRGFSIVEALLFAVTTSVAIFIVSPWLAALLLVLSGGFVLLLVFVDMNRAAQHRRQRFAQNYRPLVSLVRTDMAFNLVLLLCAGFIQLRGDVQLDGLLAIALVFVIRYLIVYMRELQRSVVYLLDLASRQDVFVTYFSGRA